MSDSIPAASSQPDRPPVHWPWTWWEWSGIVVICVTFVLLRLPLYREPGLLLGWHSDAALLGLMARAILQGDYPILFWGCDYLAPLTSVFAAAVGAATRGSVGPLALRLGVGIEVVAALLFFHAGLRRIIGRVPSLLATFWLCAGPAYLFKLTVAPLSAEQYFFVGAIAFWYVARAPFVRLHQWLLLGLLTGLGWWIHRGVLLVTAPALAVILWFDARGLRRLDLFTAAGVFTAGALIGGVPAVIGRLYIDQRLYTPIRPLWSLAAVRDRMIESLRYDLWTFLGADSSALGVLVAATMLILLSGAARRLVWARETVFAAGIVVTCAGFWLLTTEAYRGALRYVMIALPMVMGFAAAELVRLWQQRGTMVRAAGVAAAMLITSALFLPRLHDVREIVAARREPYEQWGGFDPRPTLSVLAGRRDAVCYADVWIAHKLEWLSEPTVPFIPYRSVNRRMVESLRLAALPGPKCFVDENGRVHTLSAQQQNQLRLETLWHMHGWRWSSPSAVGRHGRLR